MPKNIKIQPTVPKSVPKIFVIKAEKLDYSLPKLYIPKDANGKDTVEKPWYVWFNYRNPETGKFDNRSKIKATHGLNRYYKTVRQRKAFGKNLVAAYTELLQEGYNPFSGEVTEVFKLQQNEMSCRDALSRAFEQKKPELSPSSLNDWDYRLKKFLEYADQAGFADNKINEITTFHIASFLNYLSEKGQSPKSINNFRACLSGLWGKLANDTIALTNPVTILKKRKENPQKNKPFTPREIADIKEYLQANDPGLLTFIRFVAFAFLRPVEVVRLTVGDIDLQNFRLSVKTKTETRATVRIVPQLAEELEAMQLENFAKTDYILTPENTPGSWLNKRNGKPTAENTRTKEFSDRFVKVKKHFGFGDEYGIYSIRHSFAVDLYNSFINAGLTTIEAEMQMLPITRHKSLSGLRNYLRDVGALLPKDYGKKFTLDF